MKRSFVFTLLGFSLIFTSCQDLLENMISNPPPEFNMERRYGVFIDTTIYAISDSFLVDDRINTKYQELISIGSYEGFSAASLINFLHLPDSSQRMDSVYFYLFPDSIFGDGNGPMEIGIFEVEKEWDVSANTKDEWHNPDDMRLITTVMFNPEDTTNIKVFLDDPDLIERWQKAGDDNYGMYLKNLNDPGYILELHAVGSVIAQKWPYLKFRKAINDSTVKTDSLNVGYNVSIFDYDRSGTENIYEVAQAKKDLLISSGIAAQAVFQFDIKNTVPRNSLIHKMNLTMPVNDKNIIDESDGNILINPNQRNNFYLWTVKNMETMEIDSSNFAYVYQNGDVLELSDLEQQRFGRTTLQGLVNGDLYFEGFYVQYRTEGRNVSVKRLHGIHHPELMPSLNIQYFRIDKSGLE